MIAAALLCLALSGSALAAPTDPPAGSPTAPPFGDELQQRIDGEIDRIIQGLDVTGLQSQLDAMQNTPAGMDRAGELIEKVATGQFQYLGADIFDFLLGSFTEPLANGGFLLAELLLLIAISGVLAQLMKAFTSEGTGKVANLIVYAAASILVVNALVSCIKAVSASIDGLISVSQAVFPVLSMMLAATGGLASTAVLQPAWSVILETASWMTKQVLVPAALYGSVLAVVGNLTEKNLLTEMGSMLRSAGVWVAGAVMTVFVAVTAIQGSAAVSYDGISFRAAKYAVDSMVPYLGGMFSDMADTFVGCTLLVRNAVGMVGLLVMVVAMIEPVLAALCTYFAFRLAAALAGAVEAKQLGTIMGETAKVVMLLLVVMLMCFAMLFLMMTLTVNAGNSILSMR